MSRGGSAGLRWPCCLLAGLLLGLPLSLPAGDDEAARRLYQRAQKLVTAGEPEEALERCLTLVERHPRTPWSALALWDVHRIQLLLGDDAAAFEALDRLIVEQPGHFAKAHAAQLQLVQRLLGLAGGERRSLEPVRRSAAVPAETLVAMLRRIVRNGPESEIGIRAHYGLAVALEKAGELEEARQAHEDFAESHPAHELADDAAFQVAGIACRKWKTLRAGGPKPREQAALALAWFLERFPASDKSAEARAWLAEVRAAEQRELMQLARYYESQGKEEAAAVYHRQLALQFPELLAAGGDWAVKLRAAAVAGADPRPEPVAR